MKSKLKLIASIKIWVVIYPPLTLFLYLIKEPLSVMPLYIRTLLMTITLVPLIVFVGVPFVYSILNSFSRATKKEMERK
jgi:antibiotic biosynthesis monooxygenase (ABM) superfamily enzyme